MLSVSTMFICSLILLNTMSSHVVFGLPGGFLTGFANSTRAILAGVSFGSLSRCPNHFIRRLNIVLLHGICPVRL